jgi:hypothetical protein
MDSQRSRPVAGSGAGVEPAGWRGLGAAGQTDWVGSRNTAAQLVATSRRRRFARLDTYVGPRAGTDVRARSSTFVEMGSGLALAVGVVLASASILALVAVGGWALLDRL